MTPWIRALGPRAEVLAAREALASGVARLTGVAGPARWLVALLASDAPLVVLVPHDRGFSVWPAIESARLVSGDAGAILIPIRAGDLLGAEGAPLALDALRVVSTDALLRDCGRCPRFADRGPRQLDVGEACPPPNVHDALWPGFVGRKSHGSDCDGARRPPKYPVG